MRKISLCSACVLALAIPTASYAQDNADPQDDALTQADPSKDIIKFSDEQILLNNQAVDAGNAGDYKKAEQMLETMEENLYKLSKSAVSFFNSYIKDDQKGYIKIELGEQRSIKDIANIIGE